MSAVRTTQIAMASMGTDPAKASELDNGEEDGSEDQGKKRKYRKRNQGRASTEKLQRMT